MRCVFRFSLIIASLLAAAYSFDNINNNVLRKHRLQHNSLSRSGATFSSQRVAVAPNALFSLKKEDDLSSNASVESPNTNGGKEGRMNGVDEYRNGVTAFLANFMQSNPALSDSNDEQAMSNSNDDPLANIPFDAPKASKMTLEDLAVTLDAELYEKEWFVTGKVNPIYFADDFQFQDPDVKLTGIEDYARGVIKLFDQSTSRAQIISTVVNSTVPNTITCTWRLSGNVNIGPKGLSIKPYICYTDFTVDKESGLITFQEDRFDIPGWDILLSALFPFLIGKLTAPPAPEVPPREVKKLSTGGKAESAGFLSGLFRQLGL